MGSLIAFLPGGVSLLPLDGGGAERSEAEGVTGSNKFTPSGRFAATLPIEGRERQSSSSGNLS